MFAIELGGGAQLRPLEPWQAEEFLSHLDRARTHIAPWVGPSFVAADLAAARGVLQRYADQKAADSGGIWGVWLTGQVGGDTLVGGVMFVNFDARVGSCEVGCWLEPSAQGRGLITRAARVIIDWAVRVRGISRVEWRTNPENERSIAVARRLGMSLDGTIRAAYPRQSGRVDMQVWSVLAEEWRAAG